MVLVCTDPPFVFLKTRKTAGTSVEMVLERYCGPPERAITEETPGLFSPFGIIGHREMKRAGTRERDLSVWRQHLPAREIRKMITPAFWDSAARITTVRNPFDRAVSLFHWLRHLAGSAPLPDFASTRAAFADWIAQAGGLGDKPIVHVHGDFAPTHVIRFEHLAADLARTCAALGLADPPPLPVTKPRARAGEEPPTAAYFDAASTAIVRRECAWMFTAGGYDTTVPQSVPGAA